ncbi:MAG: NUDIX hydrolase [Rhodospirillaceae bacterium]
MGIGAVVVHGGDVLLIKRGKPPRAGWWSLPGGAQKVGETVFQGALREVKEETGVDVEIIGLIDVVDSMTRDSQGKVQYHYTLVDLACRWVSGDTIAGGDAADAKWFTPFEIDDLDLWYETRRIISLALEMAASETPTEGSSA